MTRTRVTLDQLMAAAVRSRPVRRGPWHKAAVTNRWRRSSNTPAGEQSPPPPVPKGECIMPASVLPSILRTFVPLAVGYFLAWPAARWLGLTEDQVTSLITIVITAVYYLAVRALEQVAPQFGWLLGWASVPVYDPPVTGTGR